MNARHHAVPIAVVAGLLAWLLDALVSFALLPDAAFPDRLILDLTPADWIRRIAVLVLFAVLGIILTEASDEEQETEDESLSDQLDFGQFTYQARVMMAGLDADGSITLFNRQCEEITGFTSEEALGMSFFDGFLPARALPTMLPAFKAVLSNGVTVRRETTWLTKQGPEVVVSTHLSPVQNEAGEVVGVVIVGEDVTEYRLSDAELLLSREPWRPLAESVMGDGMAAVDADGKLSWVSASLAEILGEDRDELVGRPLATVVADDEVERVKAAFTETITERVDVSDELTVTTGDGRRIPVQIALQPFAEAEDEPSGAFAIIRDLTATRHSELETRDAMQDAEARLAQMQLQVQEVEARIEDARTETRAEYQETLDRLRRQVEDADGRVEEARRSAREDAEERLTALSARLEDAEQAAAEAREAAEAEYAAEIETLRAELESAERDADEVEAAMRADEEARVAELRELLAAAEEGLAAQTRAAEEITAKLEAAEAEVQQARNEGAEQVAALEEQLASARERAAEVERDAERRLEDLRDEALTERQERVAELTAKLKAAETEAQQARSEGAEQVAALEEELASARERVAEIERDAERRLEDLRDEALTERQERLAELTAKLEAAEAEVERARSEAREAARKEFTSELSGMSARVTEAEEAVEAARKAAYEERQEEIVGLQQRLAAAAARADEAEADAAGARQDVEDLREELSQAQERIAEASLRSEQAESEAERLRVELATARDEASAVERAGSDLGRQMEAMQERLQRATDEAASAAERAASESERAETLTGELEAARTRADQARAEADAAREEMEGLRGHLAAVTAERDALRDAETERRDEVAELKERLSAAVKRAEAADEARAESEAQRAALDEQLRAARDEVTSVREDAERQAETLGEKLERARAEATEREEELAAEIARLAAERDAALEQAEEAARDAEAAHHQVADLREELEARESRLAEAQVLSEEQQARIAEITEQLADAEAEAERRLEEATEQHQREIDDISRQLSEAEERIEEIRADADARVREAREERQAELDELADRLRAREEALAERQAAIDDLQAELTEVRERLDALRSEMEMRVEQARREALEEREAEVRGLTEDVRRAQTRAEEIAEEARHEYAEMLARMSERLASIERGVMAEQEAELAARQEEISELRDQLEDAEQRAADARRLAREEYEGEIARSLAEAAAVDHHLEDARDEARAEFQEEIERLTEALAEAERRISEEEHLRKEEMADLEANFAGRPADGDEDLRRMAESLEFTRTLLDGIPYPVFFSDMEGRYQSCNTAFARKVLGLARSEVLGRAPMDLTERISEDLLEELESLSRLQLSDADLSRGKEEAAWEASVRMPGGAARSWAFRQEPFIEDDEVIGIIGAMIDISGLEAAQRELELVRESSATVLERAPLVMAEIRPDGTVSAIYGDTEDLLDWTSEELIGRDWWATLFPEELREPIRDVLGSMRSGGDLADRALRVRTKAGEERVLSWSTSNVRTAERELLSILMVGVDITDRVRSEETLEIHFREAVDRVKKYRCLSNALRLTQDENLSLVEVLSGIAASLPEAWRHPGITTARAEVWGRERSFGESPYAPVASLSSEVVVSGEVVGKIEVRYHEERPEMSEGPFTAEERELLDSVAGYLGEMIERRSAEESLAKLRQFRHTLIDQANLWLMALDRDRNVVLWNRAAERVSGYARNEVIGNDRVWQILFPDEQYRAEVTGRLNEIIHGGDTAEDWETVIRAKDGTERIISWYAHRLIDDDGGSLGAVALGRDITDHRAAAAST